MGPHQQEDDQNQKADDIAVAGGEDLHAKILDDPHQIAAQDRARHGTQPAEHSGRERFDARHPAHIGGDRAVVDAPGDARDGGTGPRQGKGDGDGAVHIDAH